ncbi:uncharacterized protein C9orf85 homolog [Cylas formicarius]|uniref:uncharacterized protein C9orf85 homolog n=1 Tax=Cylas formicarius TaxID=197179 RepID=UPI002958B6D9|nr:uncharacterized protein C9orf85 homolog [Cylas formicarius]
MSTEKGNHSRTRPQKYQNRTSFKNTLHDTSHKTKLLNSLPINEVCIHCKEVIEWKIKFKKYKALTQPKKCVKCGNKNVKHAYHIMCSECGKNLGLCSKCGKSKNVVQAPLSKEQFELDNEMKELLKMLPERKKRTFVRFMNKTLISNDGKIKENLLEKLNSLKISDGDDFSNSDEDSGENG